MRERHESFVFNRLQLLLFPLRSASSLSFPSRSADGGALGYHLLSRAQYSNEAGSREPGAT